MHESFPLQGIDITRESATGRLFLLKLMLGNTRHFGLCRANPQRISPRGTPMVQFGARRAARVSVEKPTKEAC
jgi:hypothetical protein